VTEATQTSGPLSAGQASQLTGFEYVQGLIDRMIPRPPFAELANIRPVAVERGRVTFEGVPSAQFLNPMGVVHGGWVSLLLDTAMGCAIHTMLEAGQAYTTIDLHTTFVKPVHANANVVRCNATVLHAGNRVASAESGLFDAQGELLAHASQTCLIMRAAA
jgi:uncharacterized protein (TIGR00369 family)